MKTFQIIGGVILLFCIVFGIVVNNYMDSKNRRFKPSDSYSEQYLHLAEAIYKDKARRVKKIIKEEGLDVNFTDEKCGYTPLLYAIRNSSKSVVETLLKLGADPNKSCDIPSGKEILTRYPLPQSIYNQDLWYLTILLKYGADPNLGYPLFSAVLLTKESNEIPFIKLLINSGADINKKNELGYPVVYEAAVCSRFDLVNYLLDLGADPLIEDDEGNTIMTYMQRRYKVFKNKEKFIEYFEDTLDRLKRLGIEVEFED